ncbi:TonB-dependent receptor [Plebeiibacterium marinum]|uniref:TonB-dependent receptor n=1 Tax=Plebeiibacterium marinum TaxID=2992111 RepID=A0AAE3SJA6_9BACT|nr:TonB-dependent receptor [Plebeiobacterium marinum]MCW3805537.1 TonB-dependent receptor [Plebeiobacterium marinum]
MKKCYHYGHFPVRKWKGTSWLKNSKTVQLLLFFYLGFFVTTVAYSQQTLNVNYENKTIVSVLNDLKSRTGMKVTYMQGLIPENKKVSVTIKNATIKDVLNEVLVKNGYSYQIKDNVILIGKAEELPQEQVQNERYKLTGRVTDEKGNPLPGVTIIVSQTGQGVAADTNGRYAILVRKDDVLKFSFIGFKPQTVLVDGKPKLNVGMKPTQENVDEVTVVAFGTQKKESVVSAITTVKPESLKSSNSDLTSSFAGRIPGLVAWQTGGIPGALTEEEMNTKFYIRGITSFGENANIDPLILLDNVEVSKLDLARIDPDDIESFSVMKDASATAMYGARGANGVILVTTKKGKEGQVYTSVRYEAIASMPTREIDVVDPVTYMKAYNEALTGRDPLATPLYTADKINNTGSSKFPSYVYPANDWYNLLFKDVSINHHMGMNIRGGSKIIQYYASLNHSMDHGMLNTDRLNQYDVNIRNNTTALRINLNIDLTPSAKLVVNSSTTQDKYHGPMADVRQAYQMAFAANPVDYAAVYPADEFHDWPHIRFGGLTLNTSNPYAQIQKGYKERSRFATVNRLEYIQNLSALIKGLEIRANGSLYHEGYYVNVFSTEDYLYRLLDYNYQTGEHTLQQVKEGRRTLKLTNPQVNSAGSNQLTGEFKLLHTAAWKDHTTSYTAVFNMQQSTNSQPSSLLDALPARNMGMSMRMAYGYKERYYAEGSFGYNGSERFDEDNRFGFFPAAGLGWVVSKEPFMQSASNWLTFMKLRLSYGKVGNDGIGGSGSRFVYLSDISINSQDLYNINSYENPQVTWEIAEQTNFGLEATLKDGLLDFTIDAYQEIRHNILSSRLVVPASAGLGLSPLDNIGEVRSRGIDFQGKIQKAITPDFWFILNGTLTYNKATFKEIEEALDKPVWQERVGHDISQQVGYIAEGLFQDQEEIDAAPVQSGDVMPGDIRYRDVDGDGVIDVNDAVHIGYPTTPRIIYGFNGVVAYKAFEFNFAFQGSGQRSMFINSAAISPFTQDHALLSKIYEDHWTPDNMQTKPFWPRLSTNNIIYHNGEENISANKEVARYSTYFMREVKFLRCTSLELAYNLPERLTDKMYLKRLKVFARANNPFIISSFKLWDVELGNNGFNYPIQKTFSVGANISF